MIRSLYSVIFSFVALTCFTLGVSAAELSKDYIQGNWAINTNGKCGLSEAEYLLIRADGAFENSRGKMVEGVGFWRLDGDQLNFEILTSPAFFRDLHKELNPFKGLYGHYTIRLLPFNNKADQFEAFAVLGEQMKRISAVRCK